MARRDKDLERQLDALEALGDPARRALYFYILSRDQEVSRQEASKSLKMSKQLAAFHLDKLVAAGLLEVSFRRLTGKSGPGAGRPSKLYRRSTTEIEVCLPARRYDVIAKLLARATVDAGPKQMDAVERAARKWGKDVGAEARSHSSTRARPTRLLPTAMKALRSFGYEPHCENGEILLTNCPYASVQRDSPTLTCETNLALIEGILEGLKAQGWTAKCEPRAGRCCVVIYTNGGSEKMSLGLDPVQSVSSRRRLTP